MRDGMEMKGHEVVIGRTQSGKTHYAIYGRAARWQGSLIFFNPQGFAVSPSYVRCGLDSDIDQIRKALKIGMLINYVPADNDFDAIMELDYLVDICFKVGERKILFVADESQDFADPLRRIARRGLAMGVYGVFISQRPAEMHNTLLTQAVRHVIFASSWEGQYFKRYGLDAEKIESLVAQGGQYAYVVVEDGVIKGPFRI